MAFNWQKYIDLASELKTEKDDEAKLRCAVSRAYYGAYHKTRIKLGFSGNEFANHETVVNTLRTSTSINKSAQLANQLDNLKQNRVQADYRPFDKVDVLFVNQFWARLERFLDGLSPKEEQE